MAQVAPILDSQDEGQDEGSDWEYEYDPNELEDHYLILDIPASTTAASSKNNMDASDIFELHDRSQPKVPKKPRPPKASKPVRGGTRGQGTRPGRRKKPDTPDEEADGEEQGAQSQEANIAGATAPQENNVAAPVTRKKGIVPDPTEIQLLGLHNSEPIISYGGNIYSCQWTSSIGTNLLFKKYHGNMEANRRFLETLGSWDLIALGAATLVASPATIQPRRHDTLDIGPKDADTTSGTGLDSMQIEEGSNEQDDFLKRFADIKRRKGEESQHTLTTLQGRTTADGKPIAPLRGRGRGNRRARVAAQTPRKPAPRNRSASATPPGSDQDVQLQGVTGPISTPTPKTRSTFESPPILRAPPPVFTGFPEYNLREEAPGDITEQTPGPSLAELIRNAALTDPDK